MNGPRLLPPAAASGTPLEERTDDDLMTLSQAGMREAFAVLVARHAVRAAQACARLTNDRQLGLELAQETWAAVWEHRAQYRPDGGGFVVWLITVARNRCRNHLRGRAVAARHADAAAAAVLGPALGAAASADQIDALLIEERRRRVREALGRLPAAMREALLLRYGEELRYDQMAAVLGAGESTLRSRVHHGLKLLRNLLEKRR
jgi:RNA polymerase sigma-70 factor (ECF subfamily)